MKELIKKFIPNFLLSWYHYGLAVFAKIIYGNPSNKMIVVGVTGTAGKSSTCYFISQILEMGGFKTGMTTTTLFKIGDKEWLNDKKMTMPGRFQTQRLLKRMVKQGCKIAVIETSSEGIKQFRHIGINYDILVFTNLYPEHIEAHGGFENYKQAKGKLFKHLESLKHKSIRLLKHLNTKSLKHLNTIPKITVINLDDENADYFLNFKADKKIALTINKKQSVPTIKRNRPVNKDRNVEIIEYNNNWEIKLLGEYNKYNILAAVAVARELGVNKQKISRVIANLKPLPGRLEFIENDLGIKIIVDYSFEPKAVEKLYDAIKDIKYNKIIHVLGSTGGGRDKSRRPVLGKLAGEKADMVIVTNEDPYDENPQDIIKQVAALVPQNKLYKILDRREAIEKALKLAKKEDLILITGKGAEQAMVIKNNKKIPWDDRRIVKEELYRSGGRKDAI